MRSADVPTEQQRDTAALWLAKRTGGTLSPEDAGLFEAWLNADRRHRRAYDDARVLYAQLEEPALRVAEAAVLPPRLRRGLQPRWSRVWAPMIPVLAALTLWVADPDVIRNRGADIVTSTQVISTISLPDGSTAYLGADTALKLDFKDGRRRIALLRGEAFFDVKHGPGGTFTVEANGDEVRDIGTKFNVERLAGRMAVVVAEGAVQVQGRADGTPILVRQGSQVMVAGGRSGAVGPADTDLALSWMSGRLVVQGARVEDVAAALQRHGRARIVVRGALADQQVSGTFPLTNVDDSLAAIAAALQANVVHASPYLSVLY